MKKLIAICLVAVTLAITDAHGVTVTVDLDGVDASAGSVSGAVRDTYFAQYGITVRNITPETDVYIMDDRNIYGGGAVVASSPHNVMVQGGLSGPISYELSFIQPLDSFGFTRVKLLTGPSGVTHPAWTVEAFNSSDISLGSVGEGLIASYSDVPAVSFLLNGPSISYVRFSADNYYFAGFSNAVLDNFVIPEPATLSLLGLGALSLLQRKR
jgi:hypothetical protein